MRRARPTFGLPASALAGLLAAVLLGAGGARPAHAGWWDDLDKGDAVSLSDLIAEPRRWSGKVVTFPCIHHGPDNVFQPYFTSFHAEKHLNFTAWKDGSPLWEKRAFLDDDFPYLYLRRDHPQGPELSRLEPFTRIEITGVVRDVYRERPFIEIRGFRVTPTTLGRRVVAWVKSGDGWAAAGDVAKAESHYRAALGEATLEEGYGLRIRKRLADLLRAAGRAADASGVEGGRPILGGTAAPAPPAGTLPGARATEPGAGATAPPGAVTSDDALPGSAYDAPPVRAPGADAGRGTGVPPSAVVAEDDLPGVPAGTLPAPQVPPTVPPVPPSATPPPPPSPSPTVDAPPPPVRTPRLSGVR